MINCPVARSEVVYFRRYLVVLDLFLHAEGIGELQGGGRPGVMHGWATYVYIYHQRSLTHHSQFSRLAIQCPILIYVMFVGSRLINEVGFFLKIPVWLVCYAHVLMDDCNLTRLMQCIFGRWIHEHGT